MVVKEYDDVRAFLNDYEKVLLEQEAISQLVLYNAYQCRDHAIDEKAIFGSVEYEGKAVVLYSYVTPFNLVIFAALPESAVPASAALADYLGARHILITDINARHDVCLSFIEQYKKQIDCSFSEKLGMEIMEIREVNEIKPMEGLYRLALKEEAKLVTEWMIEFQMEALTSEMDYEAALSRAEDLIEEKKIHFYENTDHQVVSMAVASRKLVHGTAITYVYTPEEYRGKGYAAANIYYLSKELLSQGNEFCTLFVDKKNPLSGRAYEKVGYKTIEENYEYKLNPIEV